MAKRSIAAVIVCGTCTDGGEGHESAADLLNGGRRVEGEGESERRGHNGVFLRERSSWNGSSLAVSERASQAVSVDSAAE